MFHLIDPNFLSNELAINEKAQEIANKNKFEIKSFNFTAENEDVRKPRIVKVGAIQNSIAAPTTDPISIQRNKLYEKIGKIIDAAGADNVNVLCLQEAWSKMSRNVIT